jgi:hypothetical protein
MMTSCASVKHTEKLAEFKKITKDICLDNPHEVELAQNLYLKYVRQ